MPKFSIIIPAHNSAGFIEKALRSIREQTYTDYELIVVCDACTDNTARVTMNYADRIIQTEHGRDGLARNAGIEASQGEYILFMDDDDWYLHEYALDEILRRIYFAPDAQIICFGFVWRTRGVTGPINNLGGLWPNVWSKCWRRSFIGETRFGDEYMESDLYFTRRVLDKVTDPKREIYLIDEPLIYYNYMREGSQTELEARKHDG